MTNEQGMLLYGDIRIYRNVYCTIRKQFRFPSSKKRRIRNKWKKRDKNFRDIPDEKIYFMQNSRTMVGHPVAVDKLIRRFENDKRTWYDINGR